MAEPDVDPKRRLKEQSAAKRDFARTVADLLPASLPERLRLSLGAFTFAIRDVRERMSRTESPPDLKAIQRAAEDLSAMVFAWQRGEPLAIDAGAREAALQSLGADLSASELESARLGMDAYSLQFVLLGLQAHLSEFQRKFPVKTGRPRAVHARLLVNHACHHFERAGLKLDRQGLLADTCEVMLEKADVKVGADTVDHLIREYIKGRGKNNR